jgi:hypothetical protein
MDTLDPAAEYLRLAEHYRQLSDEELLLLIPQSDELTPSAQQALANEVRHRGLKLEPKVEGKPSTKPSFQPARFRQDSPQFREPDSHNSPDADDPYDDDRKLVELCTIWSQRDALKVQRILDVVGIPFFMGAEKATGVDKVTSNFASGVSVQIMQVGWPWAMEAMWRNYFPEDDPTPREPENFEAPPFRCPRCRSTEVVFNRLVAAAGAPSDKSSRKFEWTCDSCGETWQDDGVAKEM